MSGDPELEAMAEEELKAATSLSWAELVKLTPWGDSFDGIGPAGGDVTVERNYIWKDEPGGDILCEVIVYRGPSRYDHGARASRVISQKGKRA